MNPRSFNESSVRQRPNSFTIFHMIRKRYIILIAILIHSVALRKKMKKSVLHVDDFDRSLALVWQKIAFTRFGLGKKSEIEFWKYGLCVREKISIATRAQNKWFRKQNH